MMKKLARYCYAILFLVLCVPLFWYWKTLADQKQLLVLKEAYFERPQDMDIFEKLKATSFWIQLLQEDWNEWVQQEAHLKHFLLKGALVLQVPPIQKKIEEILQKDAPDERILALQWASQLNGNEALLELGLKPEQPYAVRAFATLFLSPKKDFAKLQEFYHHEQDWRIRSLFRIVLNETLSKEQLLLWLKQFPGVLAQDLARYYLGVEANSTRTFEDWSALFAKDSEVNPYHLFEKRFRKSTESRDSFLREAYHYLARHQEAEGFFDCSKHNPFHQEVSLPGFTTEDNQVDLALTGLALLVFLADGSTDRSGPYAEVIQKAKDFLLRHQKEGRFESVESAHHNFEVFVPYRNTRVIPRLISKQEGPTLDLVHRYNHCIATLALLELYGMTHDPKLVTPIQSALKEFMRKQGNLKKVVIPKTSFSYYIELGDVATTAYLMQSVTLAKQLGFQVDETLVEDLNTYIQNTNLGKGDHASSLLRAYCFGGHSSLAVSLVMEKLSGHARSAVEQQERSFLLKNLPEWKVYQELPKNVEETQKDHGNIVDFHYWYYGSRALHLTGGNEIFITELKKILPQATLHYGMEKGSVRPESIWCRVGGRLYSTIMTLLAIQVQKAETFSASHE